MLHTVKATREGRIGAATATGYVVEENVPFVALPEHGALFKAVWLRNLANDKTVVALVLDCGPWNVDDHDYVFGTARPQAESGTDKSGRKTNGAGIDLGEFVWRTLGMADNGQVEWSFLE